MRIGFKTAALLLALLALCPTARAAANYSETLGGAGISLSVRRAPIPGDPGLFLAAPGLWRPLLEVAAPWRHGYAGLVLASSAGRLALLVADPASHQATLIELQLTTGRLLDTLRHPGRLWDCVASDESASPAVPGEQ